MTTTQLSAGVVVVRGKPGHCSYLLLRAYSHWDFSKGLLENGEQPIEAARREVEEETGITQLDFRWGYDYYETGPYRHDDGLKPATGLDGRVTRTATQDSARTQGFFPPGVTPAQPEGSPLTVQVAGSPCAWFRRSYRDRHPCLCRPRQVRNDQAPP